MIYGHLLLVINGASSQSGTGLSPSSEASKSSLQNQSHHSCRWDVACPPNSAVQRGTRTAWRSLQWPLVQCLSRESAVWEVSCGQRALNIEHQMSLGPFSKLASVLCVLPLSLIIPIVRILTKDPLTGKPWSAIFLLRCQSRIGMRVVGIFICVVVLQCGVRDAVFFKSCPQARSCLNCLV